jgi:RNA polymerase subunit RPABC4/transcription elongation factor Spt4
MKKNLIPVCSQCGSPDVVKDAWASWDVKTREFSAVAVVYDDSYCPRCDGETSIDWIEQPNASKTTG